MAYRLITVLAVISLAIAGCTATLTAQLEVDRPLAVTIDGSNGDS